jgi:hypothetical protein
MPQAPSPPAGSPQMFMTPQIAKRKDGLCPSLLDLNDPTRVVKPNGGLNKPYRTSSRLLLQLKGKDNHSSEDQEIVGITEAIEKTLKKHVGKNEDLVSSKFQPQGCTWVVEFSPNLNDADENYYIEIVLLANDVSGVISYVADVMLVPKVEVESNPLAPPLKGFREAKDVFDSISLNVRKAVVRLEFPEFPEGCKERAFREVYQLNARVSQAFCTN